MDQLKRTYDMIADLGEYGWTDRHSEGRVRDILLRIRFHKLLDQDHLRANMRSRGFDVDDLNRLTGFIRRTMQEADPSVRPGFEVETTLR